MNPINQYNNQDSLIFYYDKLLEAVKANNLEQFKEAYNLIPTKLLNDNANQKFGSFLFTTHTIRNNNIEFLKYLHSINCERDDCATYLAATEGSLEMLQFLHQSGYDWHNETIEIASTYGYLDCIKFAIENGCPWDENSILSAVEGDKIDVFKYLHSLNQFPIDNEVINTSIQFWEISGYETGKCESKCFNYCFQTIYTPQKFWNIKFNSKNIVDLINFDEPLWREFLYSNIDLKKHKQLKKAIEKKRKEIETMKLKCKNSLEDSLPLDIIQYCICPFI